MSALVGKQGEGGGRADRLTTFILIVTFLLAIVSELGCERRRRSRRAFRREGRLISAGKSAQGALLFRDVGPKCYSRQSCSEHEVS